MVATPGKDTTQVRTGGPVEVGGYTFAAPIGSTRPTGTNTTLDAAYIDQGYISEDGISIKTDNGVDKVLDWNKDTIATIQKANSATLTVKFAQMGVEQLKSVLGASNVVVGTDGRVKTAHYTGSVLPHRQWAFLLHDANGDRVLDIGDGQITEVGDFVFKKDAITELECQIELFKDKDGRFFSIHHVGVV